MKCEASTETAHAQFSTRHCAHATCVFAPLSVFVRAGANCRHDFDCAEDEACFTWPADGATTGMCFEKCGNGYGHCTGSCIGEDNDPVPPCSVQYECSRCLESEHSCTWLLDTSECVAMADVPGGETPVCPNVPLNDPICMAPLPLVGPDGSVRNRDENRVSVL
jgi:hypothetical protein